MKKIYLLFVLNLILNLSFANTTFKYKMFERDVNKYKKYLSDEFNDLKTFITQLNATDIKTIQTKPKAISKGNLNVLINLRSNYKFWFKKLEPGDKNPFKSKPTKSLFVPTFKSRPNLDFFDIRKIVDFYQLTNEEKSKGEKIWSDMLLTLLVKLKQLNALANEVGLTKPHPSLRFGFMPNINTSMYHGALKYFYQTGLLTTSKKY